MSTERTPRTWGEDVWPTSQQLADWLKVCTDVERLIHAEIAIRDALFADRALVRGGTYDEATLHARWHRALDDPDREPNPIGTHIRQALSAAWDACAAEAFERGLLHDAYAEEMTGRNPYRPEPTPAQPRRLCDPVPYDWPADAAATIRALYDTDSGRINNRSDQ